MSILVMDLGGTRLKAGVVDAHGAIGRREIVDVPRGGGRSQLLDMISEAARKALDGELPGAVGLCVPGLVDEGTLVSLPGKLDGLVGEDLIRFLRDEFDVDDAVVSHDVVAYATGESVAGAGRGCRRAVVVTIGTGVGVAVMQDGRPITSGMFGAGILGGFIPISDATEGMQDSTGQPDTIEAVCAAEALIASCGGSFSSVPEVYDAFARGDAGARAGIDRYRIRLTRALVALAHAHAPDRIILGGGPMQLGNPVIDGIEPAVNGRLFGTYRVEIALAALGDDAALIGLFHLLGGGR